MARSPPKALITPSPSPSVIRAHHAARRVSGAAPPQKKPRLSRPPHTTDEVTEARQASTMRLFDWWSGLEAKYSVPLGQDDEVDIITGEVVKDYGVIRGLPQWDFGRFADQVEDELPGSPTVQNEEEDSADELDTLPRHNPSPQRRNTVSDPEPDPDPPVSPLQGKIKRVGALDPNNEEDAEDLRQFLLAEAQRHELGAVVIEENGDTTDIEEVEEDASSVDLPAAAPEVIILDQDGDDESEDELATSIPAKDECVPLNQLQTPPQSSSSSLTPDVTDYFVPLPSSPPNSSLPRPRSRTPSATKKSTAPIKPRSRVSSPTKKSTVPQVQTFQSTDLESQPTPSPTKKTSATQSKTSQPTRRDAIAHNEPSTSANSSVASSSRTVAPRTVNREKSHTTRAPTDYLSPPVPPPKAKAKKTIVEVSIPRRSQSRPRDKHDGVPKLMKDRKGKQKAKEQDDDYGRASDDEIAMSSPQPGPSSSRSLATEDVRPTRETERAASPSIPTSPRPVIVYHSKKRKRLSSSDTELSKPLEHPRRNNRRDSVSPISSDESPHKSSRRRSKSARPRNRKPESDSDRDSPPRRHRARSHFSAMPDPYYGYYPPPPPPPLPEHSQHHPFVPMYHHPQAQLIISNAMHQLSSLLSGQPYPPPPPPSPYTRKDSYQPSPYRTPRKQQGGSHFDPMYSHGTLPPSSPEPESSPARKSSETPSRPSSLVGRSRSRGRRVSFRMEDGHDLVEFVANNVHLEGGKDRSSSSSPPREKRSSGRSQSVSMPPHDDEGPQRGRSLRRGQTPGPSGQRRGSGSSESPSKRSAANKSTQAQPSS